MPGSSSCKRAFWSSRLLFFWPVCCGLMCLEILVLRAQVYNAHNLYGMMEALATADALQRLRNRRQFILTRCALAS